MYYINNKRITLIDPKELGLSPRTLIGQISEKHWALFKDRKSRIIMKDGQQIIAQIQLIKKQASGLEVSLVTNAPLCSKTAKFLKESSIDIYQLEK